MPRLNFPDSFHPNYGREGTRKSKPDLTGVIHTHQQDNGQTFKAARQCPSYREATFHSF